MLSNLELHIHPRGIFTSSLNVGYYLAPSNLRMLRARCSIRNSQNGVAHSKHRTPINMSLPRHLLLQWGVTSERDFTHRNSTWHNLPLWWDLHRTGAWAFMWAWKLQDPNRFSHGRSKTVGPALTSAHHHKHVNSHPSGITPIHWKGKYPPVPQQGVEWPTNWKTQWYSAGCRARSAWQKQPGPC